MIIYLINKIISENVKFIKAPKHFAPNMPVLNGFHPDYTSINSQLFHACDNRMKYKLLCCIE